MSVCEIEEPMISAPLEGCAIKGFDGKEVQLHAPSTTKVDPFPVSKASYANCYSMLEDLIKQEAKDHSDKPFFLIVEDVYALGSPERTILSSIRSLRTYIENHFAVRVSSPSSLVALLHRFLSSLWTR